MRSTKSNLSIFTLRLLAFTPVLYVLYEYLVIAYYAIAITVLFITGIESKGWFNNIKSYN